MARGRHRGARLLLPAVLCGVAVLAGCSGAGSPSQRPAPSAPASSSSSPTSATSWTSAPPSAPSSTPPPPSTPPASSAQAPAPCRTADLGVSVGGGGGGGAAGSVYTAVRFVDTGPAACTLDGHPGVSYVGGDDGHQVGAAARRDDALSPSPVVLEPGQEAHATLRVVQQGVYDDATCQPAPVRGFRVYPPDQTASAYVALPGAGGTACASPSAPQLTVGAVEAGPPTP